MEEAIAVDDDELVRRLSTVQRPNWRRIARACLAVWIVAVPATLVWVAVYQPEHGVSLVERATSS